MKAVSSSISLYYKNFVWFIAYNLTQYIIAVLAYLFKVYFILDLFQLLKMIFNSLTRTTL